VTKRFYQSKFKLIPAGDPK